MARAAVEMAKPLAETFQTGTVKFYEKNNTTPLVTTTCRVKKPRPSAFDASNQSEWATKRMLILKIPINATTDVIRQGLIAQVSTPDGDPTINLVNFVVQSSLSAQFAAEREVLVASEVKKTPRIS